MTPLDPDPLTNLWYEDGVSLWRCKVCQHLKTEGHRPGCPVGDLLTALHHVYACKDCTASPWAECPGGRAALAAIVKAEAS